MLRPVLIGLLLVLSLALALWALAGQAPERVWEPEPELEQRYPEQVRIWQELERKHGRRS
jgi:hypothetical protein